MANKVEGAQYGTSTKEEHRASGYRYPDSFYKTPEPIDVGTPTDPALAPRKTGSKRKSGPAKNKAKTPRTSNK